MKMEENSTTLVAKTHKSIGPSPSESKPTFEKKKKKDNVPAGMIDIFDNEIHHIE